MKLLIDAMCAQVGGIATYVSNLLDRWPLDFPDDELHVIVPAGAGQNYPGCTMHEVRVGRPGFVGRPWATTLAVRKLSRQLQPDAFLATLPSTTLLKSSVPTAVVVYDLRHELRPDQFPRSRRILRGLSYTRGYQIADAFISISQRSLDDLHRLHPRTERKPGKVVHLGADHVDSWPVGSGTDVPFALAFGHHSNKNLSMVFDSWQSVTAADSTNEHQIPNLVVVGVGAGARPAVQSEVDSRGLADVVRIGQYLPDPEFQALMASASMIVFPSDFEGFGIPVPESMRLGIPVVIGPDAAVIEVAGGHGTMMAEFSSEALAEAVREAVNVTPDELAAAKSYAAKFTWQATAAATRQVMAELAVRPNRHKREALE